MVILNYILVCIIFGTTFLTIKIGIEAGGTTIIFSWNSFLFGGPYSHYYF